MNVLALARRNLLLLSTTSIPATRASTSCLFLTPFIYHSQPQRPILSNRRNINKYAKVVAKGTPEGRIAQDPSLDDRIGKRDATVHIVNENKQIGPPQTLNVALSQLNPVTEHLQRVDETADGAIVCRIVTHEWLLQQLRLDDVAAKRKDVSQTSKQIEFTWGIAENDLAYRLKRLQEFLSDGKRVEILIAPKKRGRRATMEEIDALVRRVEETAKEVEGTQPWKENVGQAGKRLEMFFSGPPKSGKDLREQELMKTEERMKRKEAELRERKEKEDKRLLKKKEQLDQRAKIAASL